MAALAAALSLAGWTAAWLAFVLFGNYALVAVLLVGEWLSAQAPLRAPEARAAVADVAPRARRDEGAPAVTTPLLDGYARGATLLHRARRGRPPRDRRVALRRRGRRAGVAAAAPALRAATLRAYRWRSSFRPAPHGAPGQTVIMPPTRLDADRDAFAERYPDMLRARDAAGRRASTMQRRSGRRRRSPTTSRRPCCSRRARRACRVRPRRPGARSAAARESSPTRSTIAPGSWTLAGTVSPQHMFGLEASVMAALRTGCALDVIAPALRRRPRGAGAAPCTTRAGRRRCSRDDAAAPRALPPLARRRRPRCGGSSCRRCRCRARSRPKSSATGDARVDEIYGSTECGMIACAGRPPHDAFTLAPWPRACRSTPTARRSPRMRSSTRRSRSTTGSRGSTQSQRRFELEGRKGDIVKVAGKRTTLDALGDHLRAHRRRRRRRVLSECGPAGTALRAGRRAGRLTRAKCGAGSPSASTPHSCRGR